VRNKRALAFPLAVMVAGTIIAGAGAAMAATTGPTTPGEIGPAVHSAVDHVRGHDGQVRGNPPCEQRSGRGNPPTCESTTTPPTCEPAGYSRGLPPCTTTTTPPSTTTTTESTTTTTGSTTTTTESTTTGSTTTTTGTTTTGTTTTTTSPSLSSTTAPPSSSTTTTTAPPVTTTASTPPGTQALAYTGTTADTGLLIGLGLLLVVGGGLMLLVRRTPAPRK
jgi:hypothetical protein